jgi:DNA repair exonuclease SbcCD ATPase subunit
MEEGYSADLSLKKVLEWWCWALSPGGIKSYVMDRIVNDLNEEANKISKYFGGAISLNWTTTEKLKTTTKERIAVSVVNQSGSSYLEGISSGERRRVDLITSLSLFSLFRKYSNSLNFIFLDEVFENLDDAGIYAVIEMLKDVSKEIPSIFVITHNPGLSNYFDKKILVEKKFGISRIVEEDK